MVLFARSRTQRRTLEGYLYLSPWVIGFLAFVGGPMLASLVLSFTRYSVLAPPEFNGLGNYAFALGTDPLVLPSFARTVQYALLSVPLGVAGALLLAVLLNQRLHLTTFWRTWFFLPTLVPTVAAAILWRWLLNPEIGVVNYMLGLVGIPGPRWFASTEWAIPGLVLVGLWGSVGGSMMIIFLAGLQEIPKELVEAARIDGAGRLGIFRHVTLPLMSPTIFFNLVIGMIFALRVFDAAMVATQGGPAYATWFISLHIYKAAFQNFEMGYASALSWMLAVLILGLTLVQFRLSGRWVFYQGGER